MASKASACGATICTPRSSASGARRSPSRGRKAWIQSRARCVMVQPDKDPEVAAHPALRASGALARIWPAWLPSMVGRQYERLGEPGLHEDRMVPHSTLVLDVLAQVPAPDEHARPISHRARLSTEAAKARVALYDLLQDRMADGGTWRTSATSRGRPRRRTASWR